jgi:predicted Zn-dependent protease
VLPASQHRVWLWSLLLIAGFGLSGCPGCMGAAGSPEPSTTEVKLLPLGAIPPELEAIRADLEATFPGMPVTVLPVEPLPPDIHHEGTIHAELLMAPYRDRGPGIMLLLDADLANQLYSAVYSQVDLPHGNAVLSLPRFRTLAGVMPKEGSTPTEADLERAQMRAGRQAIHTVGRLIGSFPCKEERCMHHRSSTVDVLDRADEVCERHQLMIAALLDVVVHGRRGRNGCGPIRCRW